MKIRELLFYAEAIDPATPMGGTTPSAPTPQNQQMAANAPAPILQPQFSPDTKVKQMDQMRDENMSPTAPSENYYSNMVGRPPIPLK